MRNQSYALTPNLLSLVLILRLCTFENGMPFLIATRSDNPGKNQDRSYKCPKANQKLDSRHRQSSIDNRAAED
jgi:hypothetical protein